MKPSNAIKMSMKLIKINCNVGKIALVFQDPIRKHFHYFITINHLLDKIPNTHKLITFEDEFKGQFFDVIICNDQNYFLDSFSEKIVRDFFRK